MASHGHPHARFRRALSTGNPRLAEAAARDLHHVSLADALELCLLYRGEPERYERAAARWIARLVTERPAVRLSEVELAAAGHTNREVAAALFVSVPTVESTLRRIYRKLGVRSRTELAARPRSTAFKTAGLLINSR